MLNFKQFIIESYIHPNKKIHKNPSSSTVDSLARNSKYGSVRIAVDHDHNLWAADSEHFVHAHLGEGSSGENVSKHAIVGYVEHHEGTNFVKAWKKNTKLQVKASHPKIDRLLKRKGFTLGH